MVEIKQALSDADSEGLWEYHLPKVAATEEQLDAAERALGVRLDPEYRELLTYANGWPSFFQSVDLFGTDDLVGGPRFELALHSLEAIEPNVYADAGLDRTLIVPIAATTVDRDLFVMPVSGGCQQPPVVWLAGYEIDRFASFAEFFHSMILYNEEELEALSGQR